MDPQNQQPVQSSNQPAPPQPAVTSQPQSPIPLQQTSSQSPSVVSLPNQSTNNSLPLVKILSIIIVILLFTTGMGLYLYFKSNKTQISKEEQQTITIDPEFYNEKSADISDDTYHQWSKELKNKLVSLSCHNFIDEDTGNGNILKNISNDISDKTLLDYLKKIQDEIKPDNNELILTIGQICTDGQHYYITYFFNGSGFFEQSYLPIFVNAGGPPVSISNFAVIEPKKNKYYFYKDFTATAKRPNIYKDIMLEARTSCNTIYGSVNKNNIYIVCRFGWEQGGISFYSYNIETRQFQQEDVCITYAPDPQICFDKDGNIYYQEQIPESPTPLPTTIPTPAQITWVPKTVTLNKETAVSGKEIIQLLYEVPDTWQVDISYQSPNPDYLFKECPEISITDGQNKLIPKIIIKPVCSGWSAKYSDKRSDDDKIIRDEPDKTLVRRVGIGHDGSDLFYDYYSFKDNKVLDAIILTYNQSSGNFIPLNVSLYTYHESSSQAKSDEKYITIPDHIVKSITAKLQ